MYGESLTPGMQSASVDSFEVGKDIALILLDPRQPVTDLNIRRPSLESPVKDDDGDYHSVFPGGRIGMAGYAPEGHPHLRQAVEFTWLDLKIGEHRGGRLWLWDPKSGVSLQQGDSGGPLYQTREDGSRDVVGVHTGEAIKHLEDLLNCGGYCHIWTDITRGAPRDWLLTVMQEAPPGEIPKHSTDWLARHHRQPTDWYLPTDHALWLLTRGESRMRLTRMDIGSGASREIASFADSGKYETFHMTLQPDGVVLLTGSSACSRSHAAARLFIRDGEVMVERGEARSGELEAAPMVMPDATLLVVRGADGVQLVPLDDKMERCSPVGIVGLF
jgi:hypothetical protein